MTGSASQIEWAERIKPKVEAEFDRVVRVFQTLGTTQRELDRSDSQAIVAIVEDIRGTVLANDHAGYYIRIWQELKDQVRHMVSQDPRYQAIRASRELRKAKGA